MSIGRSSAVPTMPGMSTLPTAHFDTVGLHYSVTITVVRESHWLQSELSQSKVARLLLSIAVYASCIVPMAVHQQANVPHKDRRRLQGYR